MSDLATVPAGVLRVVAATNNIPAAASAPYELSANLPGEVRAVNISNLTAGNIDLYEGPLGSEQLICTIPGTATFVVQLPRIPLALNKGMRLSVRATTGAAIATGDLIINCWR